MKKMIWDGSVDVKRNAESYSICFVENMTRIVGRIETERRKISFTECSHWSCEVKTMNHTNMLCSLKFQEANLRNYQILFLQTSLVVGPTYGSFETTLTTIHLCSYG